MADVNNDGRLDIYVCNYDAPNQLYVNQGDDTFREQAREYGLAVVDACLMAALAMWICTCSPSATFGGRADRPSRRWRWSAAGCG
jgi:hypothetical protein